MARKGLDTKEQMMAASIIVCFGLMHQVNKTMTGHMQDCSERSATVAKIGYGILVIVAAGLIMNGISAWHTNSPDTTQKITTYEEKHIK